jgi:hypothetical protein
MFQIPIETWPDQAPDTLQLQLDTRVLADQEHPASLLSKNEVPPCSQA